ncbi:hypothetical protein AMTR_s00027p00243560 [Amborella trichopoda]|uniref:DRBM domain-containing protein n=1 Tax=Amborella trichopoda TaxID=13333 RepID=W1PLF9_AMBTC|nr:hypothetical protein AMTR_s00027p00243560 [Amborella trichopoda]
MQSGSPASCVHQRNPRALKHENVSFKNKLQELTLGEKDDQLPTYLVSQNGTPKCRIFKASVIVRGRAFEGLSCFTKKEAEQSTAKEAYNYLTTIGFEPTTEEKLREATTLYESLKAGNSELASQVVHESWLRAPGEEERKLLKEETLSLMSRLENVRVVQMNYAQRFYTDKSPSASSRSASNVAFIHGPFGGPYGGLLTSPGAMMEEDLSPTV